MALPTTGVKARRRGYDWTKPNRRGSAVSHGPSDPASTRCRAPRERAAPRLRRGVPDGRQPIRVAPGADISLESLAEALALAGYERVERADERGQFAVRGGLVDVFPTTGREPLRIEFWGDEIEGIRAFSPFTQRALHPLEQTVIYAAAERRLNLRDPGAVLGGDDGPAAVPRDLVLPLPQDVDIVWQPSDVAGVWDEEGLEPVRLKHAAQLDPLPSGQQFAFEAQRPAPVARGL